MPSKASPFSFILAVPVIQNTWPSGSYGLPKPRSGCPNKQWREGFRYQDSENLENINFKSNGSHFSGKVSLHGIRQEFCIHMDTPGAKISWPRGKYCIYRKGKTCPTGLQEGMTLLSHIDVYCFKWWIRPTGFCCFHCYQYTKFESFFTLHDFRLGTMGRREHKYWLSKFPWRRTSRWDIRRKYGHLFLL